MSIIISLTADDIVYEQVTDNEYLKFINNKTDGKLIKKDKILLLNDETNAVITEDDSRSMAWYKYPHWFGGEYIQDVIGAYDREPIYYDPDVKSEKDDRSSFYIHDAILNTIDNLLAVCKIAKEKAWDIMYDLYDESPIAFWINQATIEEYGNINDNNYYIPSRNRVLAVTIRKIWLNVTFGEGSIPEGDYKMYKAYLDDIQLPTFRKEYNEWKKANHNVKYSPYLK